MLGKEEVPNVISEFVYLLFKKSWLSSGLWHEEDGFYYDYIRSPNGVSIPLRIRSMVGLVPLFACLVLDEKRIESFPDFKKRTEWFITNRQDLFRRVILQRFSRKYLQVIIFFWRNRYRLAGQPAIR